MTQTSDIQIQTETWVTTLQTGSVDQTLALYHPTSTLLPTLSNQVCTTPTSKKNYFEHFLAKKPSCRIIESHIHLLHPTIATHSGIYAFTFEDLSTVTARFTFVYHNENNTWWIKEHHSSLLPMPQ